MANYFNYKLVDQNSNSIPIGNSMCGVMLKNNLRQEITSFSASFACPKLLSDLAVPLPAGCLEDDEGKKYVSNMINFEVKNDLANVTIVAAPTEKDKPATLGIYKLDEDDPSEFSGSIDIATDSYNLKFNQAYNDPDYAFFMPTDNNLAYFDYRVNTDTHKGEIGVYNSSGTFIPANNTTDATVPKDKSKATEYGYENNKTRLFAHTFCLPRGRYCVGSASQNDQCVPKVYYICAQGQDDGQFDFDDNIFAGTDRVADVDFINGPRFNDDGTENIVVANISSYNPSSPTDGNKLGNRRCYVALVNSYRSEFGSSIPSNLSFGYNPSSGKFEVTSTLTGESLSRVITRISLDNYKPNIEGGNNKNLTVVLLGIESNGEVIAYPAGG